MAGPDNSLSPASVITSKKEKTEIYFLAVITLFKQCRKDIRKNGGCKRICCIIIMKMISLIYVMEVFCSMYFINNEGDIEVVFLKTVENLFGDEKPASSANVAIL